MKATGEVSVPLLRDAPGARSAQHRRVGARRALRHRQCRHGAQLSRRHSICADSDIRFRAQFARAQRAPDIAELYSPPRGNFEAADDLCDGITPTTAGRLAANCRLDPGIQALFARQASQNQDQIYEQAGNNIYSPNGGNLDLKEETADTLTLGAVFAPRFIPGLSLAVDYYDISIKDAIDAYSNRDTTAAML